MSCLNSSFALTKPDASIFLIKIDVDRVFFGVAPFKFEQQKPLGKIDGNSYLCFIRADYWKSRDVS